MRQPRRRKRLMGEINVVPYIDVMLVLLVIFIITAPLLQQGIKVDLPQTTAKTLTSKDMTPVIVSIDSHGNYYLNRNHAATTPLDSAALIQQVKQQLEKNRRHGGEQTVFVEGDKVVHYGQVMKLMTLLQKARINRVGLITTPPAAVKRQR
ncbi:MAG: protein TolR [Gammaproteobacteria bacterium]|nr:protein TolR [Gammaproteobacteria bacterium]